MPPSSADYGSGAGLSGSSVPANPGQSGTSAAPAHTLVLFDTSQSLAQNAAGTARFHRDAATEARDGVINWSAVRTLKAGGITRQCWDYRQGRMMLAQSPANMQQGEAANQFAFSLDDYQVDAPHVGDDGEDYRRLGELRIQRHEYEAKCFHGESGVRDLCVGQWFRLDGHPDIDTHPDEEREFVLTELTLTAENNLPKDIDERAQRLLSAVDSTGERNTLRYMEECSHEAETSNLLHRQSKGAHVGAMAPGRFASKDCPAVRPQPLVSREDSGGNRWYPSSPTMPLSTRAHVG
jgi:type VI secretion system secreted protein VgrG